MRRCIATPGDCNESMWPAQIVADPDIAGIGAISSFVATSSLCVLAALCWDLIHWLVRPRSEGDYEHKIQRFFSPLIAKEALIKKVLKRVILGFADQQLVTGLAILIQY
ncbi:hypothetical protein NA56DRAFT_301077 [Hyaloscypha hepaticicola]|uniref:Uncharacterized protein n=1 Tax=Hyaloscypha hepaticicola TaxID=2082293 RepID=A0A2J6PRT6_9HELO|nr:hypothetical protein NA56DRAFT_301077 [Hyaloscypha hepaticicola]